MSEDRSYTFPHYTEAYKDMKIKALKAHIERA